MGDLVAYLFVVLGVFVAVILPVVTAFVRKEFPPVADVTVPPWLRRYGALLLLSLIAGIVSLAIYRNANPAGELSWFNAFLLGFGWESLIEKVGRPKP